MDSKLSIGGFNSEVYFFFTVISFQLESPSLSYPRNSSAHESVSEAKRACSCFGREVKNQVWSELSHTARLCIVITDKILQVVSQIIFIQAENNHDFETCDLNTHIPTDYSFE